VPRLVLAALLIFCGCATSQKDPRPSLARTRTDPAGVCVTVTGLSGAPWVADQQWDAPGVESKVVRPAVAACARTQQAERAPGLLDVTLIFAKEEDRWRPEYWHAEVVRSNGLVIQAGDLGRGRVVAGACYLGLCTMEGHATLTLAEPWQAGRYRVRLTHVPTRLEVNIPITLE